MKEVLRFPAAVLCLLVVTSLLLPPMAYGCNLPVWQWALENWDPDPYPLCVFHRGELSETDKAAVEALRKAAAKETEGGARANLSVHTFDVSQAMEPVAQALWESLDSPALPFVALRYPATVPFNGALWTAPLAEAALSTLGESPVRSEMAERLSDGDTGVWLLLESGDTEQDEAAAKRLDGLLDELEKTLKPYYVPAGPDDKGPEVVFSMLRVRRDDPKEQFLVTQLLRSEHDLMDLEGPMAFPVFGRGRMLYAFIGKGINEDTIGDTCAFLVGQCSCVVKDQNPGTDLLITANWDVNAGAPAIYEFELPPLSEGAASPAEQKANLPPAVQAPPPPEVELPEELAEDTSSTMLRNAVVALVAVFMLLVVVTVVMVLRRKR